MFLIRISNRTYECTFGWSVLLEAFRWPISPHSETHGLCFAGMSIDAAIQSNMAIVVNYAHNANSQIVQCVMIRHLGRCVMWIGRQFVCSVICFELVAITFGMPPDIPFTANQFQMWSSALPLGLGEMPTYHRCVRGGGRRDRARAREREQQITEHTKRV